MLFFDIILYSILGTISIVVVFLLWKLFWLFFPLMHGGAPYVPSTWDKIASMLRLADIKPGDTVVELGSGDGRVSFAAAKEGATEVIGYEINPQLVRSANLESKKRHLQNIVRFIQCSLWRARVHRADVVFVFQIPHMMKQIEKKLLNELPPGARVISSGYQFPHWVLDSEDNGVYRYIQQVGTHHIKKSAERSLPRH